VIAPVDGGRGTVAIEHFQPRMKDTDEDGHFNG
jgi:hypothetical protein